MQDDSAITPAFPDSKEFPTLLPIELNSQDTVLVVVDMQNDFVRENGKIYTGPMVLGIIDKIRRLLDEARQLGLKIIYTQSWYEKDDPGFSDDPKAKLRKGGCEAGSWGAQIVEELLPQNGEPVVKKSSYDSFYGTDMEPVLRTLGFSDFSAGSVHRNRARNKCSAIITGTVSNVCVDKAVVGFYLRGFDVVVPMDCIAAKTEYTQSWALYQFSRVYQAKVTRSDLITIKTKAEAQAAPRQLQNYRIS